MKKKYWWIIGIVVVVLISAYFILEYVADKIMSDLANRAATDRIYAPGCNQQPGIMGGCFSTFIIKDVKLEPNISCIHISENSCNSPTIEIFNYCNESIFIINQTIPKVGSFQSPNGGVSSLTIFTATESPMENKDIKVDGELGNDTFEISFILTKDLC